MSRFISKTVQDTVIVTIKDEYELVCNLSNPNVLFPMTLIIIIIIIIIVSDS